jgi:putative membrane protein
MIGHFIRNFLVMAVVLFVTVWFLPNVSLGYQVGAAFSLNEFINCLPVLVITTFVLTVLSTVARPILEFVTAPINFITLGIFNILINIGFFYLAAYLVPGFAITELVIGELHLNSFFSYSAVAIFFGFIQGLLALIF